MDSGIRQPAFLFDPGVLYLFLLIVLKALFKLPRGPVAMHVARYKPAVTCCVGAGGRTLRIFGGVRGADMAVATYLPAPDDSADTQSVWIPRSLTGDVAHELANMVKDVIYG